MVNISTLFEKGMIRKISELEIERYFNFFESSYRDNLEHSRKNLLEFPRWSIISGYYAMHDITKLLIAKKLKVKIEYEVHATTIKLLSEIVKNKEILKLIKKGYTEFLSLANDLKEAKRKRTKVQYYTGTNFLKEEYKRMAEDFHNSVVLVYIDKIKQLLENLNDRPN